MHGIVAWIAIVGVSVLGITGIVAADIRPMDAPRNTAETLLPPDGAAFELAYDTGERWILESAYGSGGTMLLQLPAQAGAHQFNLVEFNDEGYPMNRYWRQTWTDVAGEREQITELYELAADGVRLATLSGGPNGFSFEPGLLSLPADVRAGSTWSSEGYALPQNLMGYRSTGSAAAGPDGCLVITLNVTYTDPQAADAVLLDSSDTSTWCTGRGAVSSEYDNGGEGGSTTSTPLAGDRPTQAPWAMIAPDLSRAAEWTVRDLPLLVRDPVFGESDFPGVTDGTATVTSDGTAVFLSGADIVAYRHDAESGVAVREWVAHPGGRITSLTAIGDIVLVGTTDRVVQAYDSDGVRAWTAQFDDVVIATPVGDGQGGAVIIAVDGEVRRISLKTGETQWSILSAPGTVATPAVSTQGLHIATVDGVASYALEDGASTWSVAGDDLENVEYIAASGGRVFLAGFDGLVECLEAETGEPLWRITFDGLPQDLQLVGDVLVVPGTEHTQAYSTSGRPLWRAPAATMAMADDAAVALLSGSILRVLTIDGDSVAELALLPEQYGESRLLLPVDDGLWMVSSLFVVQEVAP